MEEIIKSFTPFAIKSAGCIYVRNFETEDLIQMAAVSIIKAINMFEPSKSSGFTTYVTNSIRRNFYSLIRDNAKKASCCSLNSLNEEGNELIDTLASEEDVEKDFVQKEELKELGKALNKLSEKERKIIYWFYFQNKTLQDYAKFKGIGYRTAADIKKRVLTKLRTIMESKTGGI